MTWLSWLGVALIAPFVIWLVFRGAGWMDDYEDSLDEEVGEAAVPPRLRVVRPFDRERDTAA